jgi:hopanoid-associated phosphorylase
MLGVVCGMRSEARLLNGADVMTAIGAGRRDLTRRAAEDLVGRGAKTLVSFGTAGAINPALGTGTIVLGTEVLDSLGRRWACDQAGYQELAKSLQPCFLGKILGVDRPLLDAEEKGKARNDSGADIADMESHVVGSAAKEKSVPFLVVRVVLDDARRAIPAALSSAIDERGGIQLLAIIRAIFKRETTIAQILELRGDMIAAEAALLRCGAAIRGLR